MITALESNTLFDDVDLLIPIGEEGGPKEIKIEARNEQLKTLSDIPKEVIEDPFKFCALCWPEITLVDYQINILNSVKDNVETVVHAANEVGKDFTTAIAVLWFFCSRRPARVITSSSGEMQLKNILWGEIRERIATSRVKFPFRIGNLRIEWLNSDGSIEPLSYIIGSVTNSVENFQGHHLDHDKPRVFCIFDECSGVKDGFNEAQQSWAHRCLKIGNPIHNDNFFYEECKRGDIEAPEGSGETGLFRKIIHVSAADSPNVQLGLRLRDAGVPGPYPNMTPGVLSFPEYLRRLEIWDDIKVRTRVKGLFYEGDETFLYPPNWIDCAEQSYLKYMPEGYPNKSLSATSMGVDVGGGGDDSVWTMITRHGIVEQHIKKTPDTMLNVKLTIEFMKKYGIKPRRVCMDAGGGGKQIADRLREMGYPVRAVAFGESPTPQKGTKQKRTIDKETEAERRQTFKNRRAEMYWLLHEKLDPSMNDDPFGIPVELYRLRKEMSKMPLDYDKEGKFYLPPKDKPANLSKNSEVVTIKKLLGHSPDCLDSLVLAMFAEFAIVGKRKVGALKR